MKSTGPRCLALVSALLLLGALIAGSMRLKESLDETGAQGTLAGGSIGCLVCHAGIESMHPEAVISCVDCHGGVADAETKEAAHVSQPPGRTEDERVGELRADQAWRRFRNPMDLRVVDKTCRTCHEQAVDHLRASLHGTTAGHLSDGYYEVGLSKTRGSRFGVFAVNRAPTPGGLVKELFQVPPFDDGGLDRGFASHFADLPRKECMQCHLWSQGRAVRGRVGFDGDYRGEGCAACHVAYSLEGLSQSVDKNIPKNEPGHPLRHTMTRAPGTHACTTCHQGDASIGLNFRGLAQLPPGAPGGPNVEGTTRRQLHRAFYLQDPSICPPDLHHERGMHCIDCHTQSDVMGDGRLHGAMEHAVEITCQACHGTFTQPATLKTERGAPLEHMRREGEQVVLTSKVDGREHLVPQAVHVLDPQHARFNARAAEAMIAEHTRLECYACHSGWNPNFLGFHFSRNESMTQLDLLSGRRTPGRVTTQEKVFATWKSFYAGWNESGRIAPYLTGFSTMGSAWNEQGELVLDQVMPVTSEGLSGIAMIHHQMHTTRRTARACVECHRTSTTWGMGSENFRLARELAFVADRRGVEIVALARADLSRSAPLAKVVLPDVVALATHEDPLQGHAQHIYAAEGGRGIHVIDVSDPTRSRRRAFAATVSPHALELAGNHLYVADGPGGVKIFDVARPDLPRLVGSFPSFDAQDVDLAWPWLYVADGPGGLLVLDVRAPIAPRFVAAYDANGFAPTRNRSIAVETLFQYSRPRAVSEGSVDERSVARMLCIVLDAERGLEVFDVTEPAMAELLFPTPEVQSIAEPAVGLRPRGMALLSQVDFAEPQGGESTRERDYVYLLLERGVENSNSSVLLYDISDPEQISFKPRSAAPAGGATEGLLIADFYNPPFLQRIAFAIGRDGIYAADVSNSRNPRQVGLLPGLGEAYAMAVERFPLDLMIDAEGRRVKDVSHVGSRWLYRAEIERLIDVPAEKLNTSARYSKPTESYGTTARLHLATLDANNNGFLEGDEFARAGGIGVDDDGDRRITLLELGRHGGLFGENTPPREDPSPVVMSVRALPDGDLARLLDGTSPYEFDGNADLRLDRKETESAFFSALDLDASAGISQGELSRHPGALRQLRYGDAGARKLFEGVDSNRDGKVARKEFRLSDDEWLSLDADADGYLRLIAAEFDWQRSRGFVQAGSEWPSRRPDLVLLPPGTTSERLRDLLDADRDGVLTRKELNGRLDLLESGDRSVDGNLSIEELDVLLSRVDRLGTSALPDDFVGRWDLDGNSKVERHELPSGARLRLFGPPE